MTVAIEPFLPGERPTEPGWYVAFWELEPELRQMVQVFIGAGSGGGDRRLGVWMIGYDEGYGLSEFSFIARIYPDRIEGREG